MRRETNIIGLQYSQSQVGSYVCIVGERNGNRKIPVIIKPTEAQMVALAIEDMRPPRPMTYHVIQQICESFQLDFMEAEVYRLSEGIFLSRLALSNGVDVTYVESTVGDAIALSLMFGCPFYIEEVVFAECGIEVDDDGVFLADDDMDIPIEPKRLTIDELETMLRQAEEDEEYEMAAQYRDRINELKSL